MGFTKITNAELNSRGATTLPNQPTISATALKQEFDAPAKNVVAPKVNNLIDELEASTSAASLGATPPTGRTGNTVQALLNNISTAVDGKSKITLSNVATSGVRIATVVIDGNPTDLKAPEGGSGGGTWGTIGGTLSDQTDLQDALDAKADSSSLAGVATSGLYSDLSGTPSLATVATSGSYSDLSNKPTIPDELKDLTDDSTHRTVTDTEKSAWSGKSTVTWNQQITTGQQIATVTIDGTTTNVFAPTGGGGGGGNVDSVNGKQGTVILDLGDMDDANFTSLADNHVPIYDSTDQEWQNAELADVALSGQYSDLSGTPTLATVATSGSYTDLSSKPTIPTVSDSYSGTSGDAMSGKAVKAALQTLDGSITGTPATSKTLSAFSETDGVVSATFSNISITKSQISDFPSIPTVNDATLTIQKNGTTVNTFTANASSNVTANIVTGEYIKTASVSSGSVTFTGVDDSVNSGGCGYDVFFDVTSSSTNKSPYAKLTSISGEGTSNCTLTYQTDADDGTNTAHLYQYK